jgi:hypothetical protein
MRRIDKIDYRAKLKLTYDPDDVNIRLQHFRVSELVSMINGNSILNEDFDFLKEIEAESENERYKGFQPALFDEDDLIDIQGDDGLQRNTLLWSPIQKSQFIESLMIKLPIPLFYFDGSRKPWRIVDGLQRLHTIMSFINNKFKLVGLEYLEECEGLWFNKAGNVPGIPGLFRKRVLDAEIVAYVINPGTPPDVKYNIFKRINTGGLKLNGQEIRNAFFRGAPADFTKKLATEEIFKKVTNNKVTSRRMIDREYVNRFIAFQVFDYKDYNGKMDLFLSEALMDLYERGDGELEELHTLFLKSLTRAFKLFEKHAFYRPKDDLNWGKQPNKALFDTLSWNLNMVSEKDFGKLLNRKNEFKKAYFGFMNSDTMYRAINDTTSSKTSVINRFRLLNDFLKNFIK